MTELAVFVGTVLGRAADPLFLIGVIVVCALKRREMKRAFLPIVAVATVLSLGTLAMLDPHRNWPLVALQTLFAATLQTAVGAGIAAIISAIDRRRP